MILSYFAMNTKNYNNHIHTTRGAAMIIAVLFFVFISITILVGITTPVVREFKIAGNTLGSKQAYFLAESGVEDAFYRIKNNKQISASEVLSVGSNTTTTTITTLNSNQKTINSLGDATSNQRKVSLSISTNQGVSFNYGVQVGLGGLDFQDGVITGNVYSNGPIYGDSSTTITGTAISANSPSQFSDQSNGSGTPSNNISFGNASLSQDMAQSFQVSDDLPVSKVSFYLKKVGSPSNGTVKILSDNNGSPSTTVLASGTLSASSVTTSYSWIDVSFSTNPTLSQGTTYWVVVDASTSASNYYVIGANSGGYSNGVGKIGALGGTWNNTTPTGLDYYFNLYLGGVYGIIASTAGQYNPVPIGGNAQAHSITSVSATGTIYCQVGTTNNKSCNTTQADPVYIAYPVSDANITQWESDAVAGGIITGNYSVGYAGATLGPKKIIGNLDVSGGGVLTVTGPLWVTGNISLSGGAKMQLASSYGANDGVVVADGTVSVSGGSYATGSGVTGSYIMIVSNNSSGNAASITGGAGAMILYVPYGTINIEGGASLKEATGYKIHIEGGSHLTYESGLSSNNFSSGPSGSWTVGSWSEAQ
jgi:Tfp pilus assembly protein PilX